MASGKSLGKPATRYYMPEQVNVCSIRTTTGIELEAFSAIPFG